jgi:hypothetical protein
LIETEQVASISVLFFALYCRIKVLDSLLYLLPEGRRPLGRPRRRWEDNIKIDLREIGFGDVDWIHLAQDRDRL